MLVIVTVSLVAGPVLLSRRRLRTLVQLGVGTAAAAVVTMSLLRNASDNVAGQAPTPQGRAAAGMLADSVLDSLRTTMLVVLVVALLVALIAHLAGRPGWAQRSVVAIRRATAAQPGGSDLERFAARHEGLLRIVALALGVLALALWGITLLSLVVASVAV